MKQIMPQHSVFSTQNSFFYSSSSWQQPLEGWQDGNCREWARECHLNLLRLKREVRVGGVGSYWRQQLAQETIECTVIGIIFSKVMPFWSVQKQEWIWCTILLHWHHCYTQEIAKSVHNHPTLIKECYLYFIAEEEMSDITVTNDNK